MTLQLVKLSDTPLGLYTLLTVVKSHWEGILEVQENVAVDGNAVCLWVKQSFPPYCAGVIVVELLNVATSVILLSVFVGTPFIRGHAARVSIIGVYALTLFVPKSQTASTAPTGIYIVDGNSAQVVPPFNAPVTVFEIPDLRVALW